MAVVVNLQANLQHFRIATVASWILAGLAVYEAFNTRPTAHSALVELSSGFNVVVICFAVGSTIIELCSRLQYWLFGELRLIELERMREHLGYDLLNTTLTIAMFRTHSFLTVIPFALSVLYSNIYQRILMDRLDYTFQHVASYRDIFKSRAVVFSAVFLIWDRVLLQMAFGKNWRVEADLYTLLGLELVLTGLDLAETTFRHVASFSPSEDEEVDTEDIFTKVKVLEVLVSICRLMIIGYVLVKFLRFGSTPIFLCHSTWRAGMKLKRQVTDWYMYMKIATTLDSNLKNATELDLEKDNICIICRDEMELDPTNLRNKRNTPKKLQCGHILHLGCLKSWIERSQSCPMCRAPVFKSDAKAEPEPALDMPNAPVVNEDVEDVNFDNDGNAVNENPESVYFVPIEPVTLGPESSEGASSSASADASASVPPSAPTSTFTSTSAPMQGSERHTEPTSLATESQNSFSLEQIPRNMVLPPGWIAVPLRQTSGGYEAIINRDTSMRVVQVPRHGPHDDR